MRIYGVETQTFSKERGMKKVGTCTVDMKMHSRLYSLYYL